MRTLALAVLLATLPAPPAQARLVDYVPATMEPVMSWRPSRALGRPEAGRLVNGVQLPAAGADFWTYDWGTRSAPNRPWRRWGTDRLLRTVLRVVRELRLAHPDAARVGIADLSRPRGGPFGREYGGLGHASHQSGRDADILYPRIDNAELHPWRPALVDRALAQELVDRFVAAGAERVFTGLSLGLRGPRGVVTAIPHHDDHLHVRVR